MRNFPYPAILITLVSAIGAWSLNVLGLFDLYDAQVYDMAVRYGSRPPDTPSVLLITANEDELAAGDSTWLDAIETLEALGARQIVFTFTPQHVSSRFYERAVQLGNLVFGRFPQFSVQSDAIDMAPWPPAAQGAEHRLIFGAVVIPPADSGVYRRNHAYYQLGSQNYPILETQAAKQMMGQDQPFPESDYWVDFSGGLDYLPVVALPRLLAGELIPELVRGKSVLIGPALAAHNPGLHTPIDRGGNPGISPLVFQGFALQTLLGQQTVHPMPEGWQLVILLLVSTVNVVLYQLGRYQFGILLTGAAAGVYAVSGWLLPAWFLLWPPVTALVVVQIATFILVSHYKFRVEEATTRRLIMELSGQSHEKRQIPGFYTDAEPWAQVVNFVKQTLDLSWLIFLERLPGQYYVKEIIALNCSLADIDERRRDYRRLPYSEAMAENRLVRLQKRLFLRLNVDYEQYLTPLVFGGEVLGFWVMGLPVGKNTHVPEFFSIVNEFSVQIAEMIYHRQQWLQQQKIDKIHDVFLYLRLKGGENFHGTLKQNIAVYQRRLLGLEQIFDSIGIAAVFYNPFGSVIQVNHTMEELMKKEHILIYQITALDLLCLLCQLPMADSQRILRQVFTDHKATTLPAHLPDNPRYHYLLHVRPVVINPQQLEAGEVAPFQLRGILIELVDVTSLHDLSVMKSGFMEHIYFQLRNDLQTILLAADLLNSGDQPASNDVLDMLKQQVDDAIRLVDQAQDYLFKDLIELQQIEDSYPVELLEAIHATLDAASDQIKERQLKIEARLPELVSLVLAEPNLLRELLKMLLTILIDDAITGSTLSITMIEQEQTITCTLSNQGFGMPNSRFQDYLTGSVDDLTPAFKKLRTGIRQMTQWSGELTGASTLGEGICFELKLRCFI